MLFSTLVGRGAALSNEVATFREEFAFAEVLKDKALKLGGVGSQNEALFFFIMGERFWIIFEEFFQPIEIAKRQFRIGFKLRNTKQKMAGNKGERNHVSLLAVKAALTRHNIEKILLAQLEEMRLKLTLLALFFGDLQ